MNAAKWLYVELVYTTACAILRRAVTGVGDVRHNGL
jgi:hypothetical protein